MDLEKLLEQNKPLTRREEKLMSSAWHWGAQMVREGATRDAEQRDEAVKSGADRPLAIVRCLKCGEQRSFHLAGQERCPHCKHARFEALAGEEPA